MLCSLGMTLAPSNAAARSLGPGTYANPVCNQWDCADPTVERGPDGRFYLVSSGGWGKQSVDMVNWTDGYGKMESMPTWNGYEGLWAPDVTRIGDKYVMYYAHSQWMGDLWDKCGVGVAISDNIAGPYVDGMGNRLLDGYFHTVMAGNAYFYDPSNLSPILTDDAGDEWVIYNAVQASASHTYPVMLLDRVRWQDGWPRISDGYPSYYPTRAPLIR